MGIAKLAISDGTTEISLLDLAGIHLAGDDGWTPKIIQAKGGGVFQDSSMAAGRRLVYRQFGTAREDFTFNIMGISEDELIAETSDLLQMLEKAVNYWDTDWQSDIVYLIAQSDCETYARYAPILYYEVPELQNPYGQPFIQAGDGAIFDDIGIMIERGHWQDVAPGDSNCTQISNDQEFIYTNFIDVGDITGSASQYGNLLEATNGYLYIGDFGNIYRSTDGGDTWANNTALPTNDVNQLIQLADDTILATISSAGGGEILNTTDNGANWNNATTDPTDRISQMIELDNGDVLALSESTPEVNIYISSDSGDNWVLYATTNVGNNAFDRNAFFITSSGAILIGANGIILRSTDDGLTWIISNGGTNGTVTWIIEDASSPDNLVLFAGTTSSFIANSYPQIYKSTDDGLTWNKIATITDAPSTDAVRTLFIGNDGFLYICSGFKLYRSIDGYIWKILYDNGVDAVGSFGQISSGEFIYVSGGASQDILKNDNLTYTIGKSETCDKEVFVANKSNLANITNLKIYDASGPSYTDIIPITSPQDLFPASVDTGDILYCGIDDTSIYPGVFCNLIFNIGTALATNNSVTIVTEYYNGGWVTLTTRDYTDLTNPFTLTGVNSICFETPSDWTSVAIDSVTAKWIRFRVSAETGTTTPPTQVTDDIYTVTMSYVEINELIVLGDISALSRVKAFNQSDEDGSSGNAPDLWSNRLIVGLRSVDRGNSFQSYINLSDVQQLAGISATAGTNTTFGTSIIAPTARAMTYNPGGVEAIATRATVTLSTTIARDFYGSYHAFLRVQRTAGASTDFDVQLVFVTGSGGIQKTTQSKQVQTTTKFELLDFGQVTIPVGGSLASSDLGDQIQILIQASAASGVPNLVLYDLILIPVDEWAIDSVDQTNSSTSDIGRSGDIQKLLDIDSVTDPKNPIKSIVRQVDSDFVTANYNPITNGPAILQSNVNQRLWFLAAQTSATGSSYSWIAPPEIVHSVQLYKAQRYLGLRGNR